MPDIQFALPGQVMLPAAPIVDHQQLRLAIGDPSRQLLRLWRTQRSFPRSFRDGNSTFCVTAEIEKWLIDESGGAKLVHGSGGIVPLRAA